VAPVLAWSISTRSLTTKAVGDRSLAREGVFGYAEEARLSDAPTPPPGVTCSTHNR
jgi:hypothetical protein